MTKTPEEAGADRPRAGAGRRDAGAGSVELRAELFAAMAARPAFAAVAAADWRRIERFELGGLWSSSAALAVGALATGRGRVVVVLPDPESAEGFALDLGALAPDLDVALLPVEEEGLPDGPELRANRSERLVALAALDTPGDGVLLVSGASLLEALPAAPAAGFGTRWRSVMSP